MRGVMMFVVIALIGTGWTFVKPFLSDKDKKIFLIVIPLQIIDNIAMVIIEETTPGTQGWFTWVGYLNFFLILYQTNYLLLRFVERYLQTGGYHLLWCYFGTNHLVDQALEGGLSNRRQGGQEHAKVEAVPSILPLGGIVHLFHKNHCVFAGCHTSLPLGVVG